MQKYNFSSLGVGDRTTYPGENTYGNLYKALHQHAKKNGKVFECRTTDAGLVVERVR